MAFYLFLFCLFHLNCHFVCDEEKINKKITLDELRCRSGRGWHLLLNPRCGLWVAVCWCKCFCSFNAFSMFLFLCIKRANTHSLSLESIYIFDVIKIDTTDLKELMYNLRKKTKILRYIFLVHVHAWQAPLKTEF